MANNNNVFWDCFKAIAAWHILGAVFGVIVVFALRGHLFDRGGGNGDYGDNEMYEMQMEDDYY